MARAVIFTYSDPPHAAPPLAIFAALARRGEELTIYSDATYREGIEAAGATYRGYRAVMSAASTGLVGGMLRRIAFAEQVLPEVLEGLRADRPDYLILDAAAICGSVAAGLLRLPAVSYRTGPAIHRGMYDAAGTVRRVYRDELPGYLEVAQSLDRQYGSRTGDLVASLECRCDLNLVPISRALQPEADIFDGTYHFVGPCLGDKPEPERDGDRFPWDELGPNPLIYISLGTVFNDHPEFFRAFGDAFGGLPFRVVVSLGRPAEHPPGPAVWGPAPPNFLVARFVPQAKLLERTTLAITHAGSNTVEECARAGVPQLVYPQAGCQFILADRVQQLGAGLRLDDADIEGRRLRELAGRVMADPSYCRAAAALSESVRESGGAAQACGEILAFAGRISQ
jgi:MGT family glycosyltransferase